MSFHAWMIKFIQWPTHIRVQMNRKYPSPSLSLSLPLFLRPFFLFLFFNFGRRLNNKTAECGTGSANHPPEPGEEWSNEYLLGIILNISSKSATLCTFSLIPSVCVWSSVYITMSHACMSDSRCWNVGPLSLTSVRLTVTVVEDE